MIVPPRPALARDRVRHVGDPVAFVVADTQRAGARRRRANRGRVPPAALRRRCGRRRSPPARRCCGTRRQAICPTASSAATRRRSRRPLPRRRISSRSRSSTTASSSSRSSRAPRSAATMPAADRLDLLLTGQGVHSIRNQLAECGLPHAARAHRGARARCRRRVRDQEFPLSRMGAGAVGGAPSRAAGPLGRRARRGFSHLRAGPRQPYARPPRARSRTGGFSRSMSIRSPISAPISRPTARAARQTRRPARWAGSTTFRPCSWRYAASLPTPCRSTPIAAPASPRPIT